MKGFSAALLIVAAPSLGEPAVASMIAAVAKANTSTPRETIVPLVSYHEHLLSPTARELSTNISEPILAKDLVKRMDEAQVRRAVVLPVIAYRRPALPLPAHEYEIVRAENDWIAQQVSLYPDRLVAFCGINPIADYAEQEVARCSKLPHVKGVKVHFFNSGVDVRNPLHLEKVRRFFKAANDVRMPILVHHWTRNPSEPIESETFLSQLLPLAPDIIVTIAHMAGNGAGVFVDALKAGDRRTKNLFFDFSGVSDTAPQEKFNELAERMRQIGLKRVLFGSDLAPAPPLAEAWTAFRKRIPLSDGEVQTIAENVAPYLR